MKFPKYLVWLFVAALLGLAGCGQVDQGQSGIFLTWGKMEQKSYGPGLYFYNPFSTNMDVVNVQVQRWGAQKLGAATSDVQEIHADIVINYTLDADKVHVLISEVGHDYVSKLMPQAVLDSLKTATAQFTLGNIIKDRPHLRSAIFADLKARLSPYYINLKDVALTNFEVSPAFVKAVEEKQIAEQRIQQAEYERQTTVMRAQARVAEAKGQAEANRLLADSLRQSPETLRFKELEVLHDKWDGQFPSTMIGGGTVPFIQVPMGPSRHSQ